MNTDYLEGRRTITISDVAIDSSSVRPDGTVMTERQFMLRVRYSNNKIDNICYDTEKFPSEGGCDPSWDEGRRAGALNVIMRTLEERGYRAENEDLLLFVTNERDSFHMYN